MTKSVSVYLLGADDPEMREMERILKLHQQQVEYAMKDGVRCHPGNAYKADGYFPSCFMMPIEYIDHIVMIECDASTPEGTEVMHIDHHRQGDPGYGLPSEQFWLASSLGQLCEYLGINPDHSQVILAAMDHCPASAIRGECPGVTAQEVVDRKIDEIAKATGVSHDEVRQRIAELTERLEVASSVEIGGQELRDMRPWDTGSGYSLDYLCSQVATLAGGYGVLLKTHDRGDSREKWTIAGHCSPQCVAAFMTEWAPVQGLMGIYGVPNRGYAGGYRPQ